MQTTNVGVSRAAGRGRALGEVLTGALIGALCALVLLAGCEAAGGAGGDAAGGSDTAAGAEVAEGSGPAAACGGVRTGEWVSGGGAGSAGDSTLTLRVAEPGRPLDLLVRVGNDGVMLGFVNEAIAASNRPRWGADRRTVLIGPVQPEPTSNAAVSGAIFDGLNNGFGGVVVEGRLCFDAEPQTGQSAFGSWVFVLSVGAEGAIHRVQGTFAVPGEAVAVGPGDALVIDARPGATVVVE